MHNSGEEMNVLIHIDKVMISITWLSYAQCLETQWPAAALQYLSTWSRKCGEVSKERQVMEEKESDIGGHTGWRRLFRSGRVRISMVCRVE